VASTLTLDPDPNKVVSEVLAGIKGILKSAAKEPSVERFVYTSCKITESLLFPVPTFPEM